LGSTQGLPISDHQNWPEQLPLAALEHINTLSAITYSAQSEAEISALSGAKGLL